MSIRIKLRKNEIKSNRNYGQYFAETVSMGTVGVEQMAEEISQNCTLKSSDVQGALIALQEVMASHLQNGEWFEYTDRVNGGKSYFDWYLSDLYDGTTHAGFPSVYQMFEKCSSLTTIGNVTLDHIISLENLFYDCTSLTSIGTLYAPEAVNLHSTFCNCTSLAICPPMTISTTASNFNSTFYHCGALTACPIIPTFLNNATNCGAMFAYCRSLTAFPEFDMSHVTSMSSMFISCESITGSIPVYDLRNVDNCGSAFNGCKNVSGGILDTYNRFMSYTIQPTEHRSCFSACGSNTQTGSAELAQIPSDWK